MRYTTVHLRYNASRNKQRRVILVELMILVAKNEDKYSQLGYHFSIGLYIHSLPSTINSSRAKKITKPPCLHAFLLH